MLGQLRAHKLQTGTACLCATMTQAVPNDKEIDDIHTQLLSMLKTPHVLIFDMRNAVVYQYLPFIPRLIDIVNSAEANAVIRAEIWLAQGFSLLLPFVQSIIDDKVRGIKMIVRAVS